tara:strand:+ start:186 stop:446 length:261 start_codon:yes stop_codon:yes gene_type:complete
MIDNAILKINPNAVFVVRGNDIDTCEIEWLENTTPISKEDIKAQLPTVEAEFEQSKQDKIDLKASAKAKLIAGEALTEEEADTIVI